jgi:hypothetical protein
MLRAGGLALVLAIAAATPGAATGLAGVGSSSQSIADGASGLVHKVHGCHRFCAWGYVPWWGTAGRHRHAGPYCEPRPCGRRFKHRPGGIHGCFKIGPVWYCP